MSNGKMEGKSVADAVNTLEMVLPDLPESKQSFAHSIVNQYNEKGWVSERQMYWVGELTKIATGVKAVLDSERQVGTFVGVYNLFEFARKKLKFPKIHLLASGYPVTLALSSANARHPNTINVTDGGPFGANKWYGRVLRDGTMSGGRNNDEDEVNAIMGLLKEMSSNPAKVAKDQSVLTGRCMFCNLSLKDEHSTAAGFGPVCAKNYGLEKEWKKSVSLFTKFAEAA